MLAGHLWAVFTIVAAFAQTLRNATQRALTGKLGTAGATYVRFLFSFPFVAAALLALTLATGAPLPRPRWTFWPWVVDGALAQVLATALMLVAMGEESFVVTIAYIKTEPIQVAIFGLIFLGDAVSLPLLAAILIATAGVLVMAIPSRALLSRSYEKNGGGIGGLRPALVGLAGGAMFALSAVGFRGAILDLHLPNFVMAASFTLAVGVALQAGALLLYLCIRNRALLAAILRAWKLSLFAGIMGAFASQFWFLAFALATAARVRTLGLVEVLFAQIVARFAFGQKTSARQALGMALLVAGVVILILQHG
jgi:drug/metabolite transporter (DMT)-like permease